MSEDPIKTTEAQENSPIASKTSLGGQLLNHLMPTQQNSPKASTTSQFVDIPGVNAIGVLRFFAWSDLIASIIGAILVWINFYEREVGVYFTYTETNPIGIAAGFVVLFQGIITFTVFLVIAAICENTIEIRKKIDAMSR